MSVSKFFRALTAKLPWTVQAFQAGTLMSAGDAIAQIFVEKKPPSNFDFVRSAKFGIIGFGICGPALRKWYIVLDKRLGNSGTAPLNKVLLDQLLFAPIFIVIILGSIGLIQGFHPYDVQQKLIKDYPDVLVNNFKVWPAVQLCNFYLVPLQYQVLLVQTVAIFWNTYLSWKSNRGNVNDEKQ